jgi:hypothetical protein
MGLEFLSHIKTVDILIQVLRGYEDPEVTHYDETIDPVRDMHVMNHELMMYDLLNIEHLIGSIEPIIRGNQAGLELKLERETLIEAWEFLAGIERPNTLHPNDGGPIPKAKPKKSGFTMKRDFSEAPPPTFAMPTHCYGFPLRLKTWTRRQIDLMEKSYVSTCGMCYLGYHLCVIIVVVCSL